MKARRIVITVILIILAVFCVIWAGFTVAGVDIIDTVKNIFNISTPAKDVKLENDNIILGVGQEEKLNISLMPEGSSSTYTFSSTDNNTVNFKGNTIRGVKKGECTIKVKTDNNLTDYAEVTVLDAPSEIAVPKNLNIAKSEKYTFKPDKKSPDKFFTYESSDENVATVDSEGQLAVKDTGKCVITVKSYNGLSGKTNVSICNDPTSIKLNPSNISMVKNRSVKLVPEFNDGEGTSSVKFSSSNKRVATVDNNGNVKTLSVGSTTITCTLFNGISAKSVIDVSNHDERIRTDLDPNKPMVALTFDDGPYNDNTLSILNTLEKYNGRGTFFVVGQRLAEESDILKREYDGGHEIGNHSWDHKYADDLNTKEQREEMNKTNNAIKKITGDFPTVFRCPGGISGKVYERENISPLILWSIDTLDWKTKDSNSTFKNIKKVFKKGEDLDGDIVLMHDIQTSTPKAVKNICKYLNKKGYQFVTVSELAYYKGYEMKNGETYSSFY